MAERSQVPAQSDGPFRGVDAVLAGRTPRMSPDGLRYEDPSAVYQATMASLRRDGLVN